MNDIFNTSTADSLLLMSSSSLLFGSATIAGLSNMKIVNIETIEIPRGIMNICDIILNTVNRRIRELKKYSFKVIGHNNTRGIICQ